MAHLLLCRHGQDEDNAAGLLNGHRDRPLTALGLEQASTVAKKIHSSVPNLDVVLCSPLQRAKCTAEIIAEECGVPVIVYDELIERDFGILSGKRLSDIPKFGGDLLETEKVTYFLSADGAEGFDALYHRAKHAVLQIDTTFANKTVLLVCHGDIGKMILAVRRCIPWKEALTAPYIDNTTLLDLRVEK